MRNLMLKAAAWKQARQPREEGQTVIEYALIVAVVSIVPGRAAGGLRVDASSVRLAKSMRFPRTRPEFDRTQSG